MNVPRYVVLEKPRGKTPLETIDTWKAANPEFAALPASYAGRLDPMAEGKLLVIIGEECKRQQEYTKLDKEYEVEVLLDLSTDSGDVLGIPTYSHRETNLSSNQEKLKNILKLEVGAHSRKYPIFSSKTVAGKPLFLYSLEGTIDTITIPEHIETMYGISMLQVRELSSVELQVHIRILLSDVPRSTEPSKLLGADFRQDEIREKWEEVFSSVPERRFAIAKIRVTCGSGAYMRTLAERVGATLGTSALALSIRRTKIGKYVPLPILGTGAGIWTKTYA